MNKITILLKSNDLYYGIQRNLVVIYSQFRMQCINWKLICTDYMLYMILSVFVQIRSRTVSFSFFIVICMQLNVLLS